MFKNILNYAKRHPIKIIPQLVLIVLIFIAAIPLAVLISIFNWDVKSGIELFEYIF